MYATYFGPFSGRQQASIKSKAHWNKRKEPLVYRYSSLILLLLLLHYHILYFNIIKNSDCTQGAP